MKRVRLRPPVSSRIFAPAILAVSIAFANAALADITGFNPSNYTLNANPDAITAGVPNITGGILNLTTAANSQATSAFFNTAQTVTNFTASFTYDFLNGSGNPADGFAFVLQNSGLSALGGGGGAVGYEGITSSVALKFNIYNDDGMGFGSGGVTPGTAPTLVSLTGANPINITLNYDGTYLGAKLTDSVTGATDTRYFQANLANLIGSNTAFVGFTGGTGGENAAQAISNFTFTIGTGVVNPTGFKTRQVRLNSTNTANLSGGTLGGELENIDEGEALLNGTNGFLSNGQGSAIFSAVNNPFPLGGGDQFAISSEGYVDLNNDGFDGDTGTYTLYVDSDDGFRLRLNGNVIGEFTGPTGSSNVTIPGVTLKDGDKLTLNFFEKGGGEKLVFRVGDATGALVGTAASGIAIKPEPVPEPGSASILALSTLGLVALRRRRA